ncbi:hypothetical protein PGT21_026230 [Puccinia graminis f. sp. tritici]|uniref:Uncharacterized protein n=1 Tax=Puccinia graminis f. sp. tritici TaxID=56615 RepID=A0A5B0RBA1_PUCGR|nr:hypothetical protein PGT21_026230 [Puccinia graminis f. sp. tritici]KAA1122323.1 hypothetical protein PGTUg99_036637 [Puccinia graminis f. sp. tritici]
MKSHFSLLMVALVVLLTFEPAGADSKTFPADSSPFPCQSPGSKLWCHCYWRNGVLVIPSDSQCTKQHP